MASQSFKQLLVWQKAHEFVLAVYKYTNSFPKTKLYALTSQFRKAAISVAANIAEGNKKKNKADKAVRCFNHILPKFYLLTPNFYILCLI